MAFQTFADVAAELPSLIVDVFDASRFHFALGYVGPAQLEEQHAEHTVKTAT